MSENLQYEQRIIALIDILGFKQLVSESKDNSDGLELIHKALCFLKGHEDSSQWDSELVEIENCAQARGLNKFPITPNCICFSDSIVVSTNTDSKDISGITSTLISKIALMGAKLLARGILIRGAITIGELLLQQSDANPQQVQIDPTVIDPERIRAVEHSKLAGLQVADAVASGFHFALKRNRYGETETSYLPHLKKSIYRHKGAAMGYGLKLWPEDFSTVKTKAPEALNLEGL